MAGSERLATGEDSHAMLTTLREDLARFGPGATDPPRLTLEEARAYNRRVALGHYENFPVVTWFLPAKLRQPFCDVYAFCRWSDDLGDELDSPEEALRLLDWWRTELQACPSGEARHPVFVALRETLRNHDLALEPFHDLITAFERDQRQTRYETYADLLDYCRYSANPVGRILLRLTGSESPRTLELSDDVCTGLQLINFWQDVARDWEIGRVYLPREDREQFGASETHIAKRHPTDAFRALLCCEVDRAEALLNQGRELGQLVDRSIRLDIRLFALGGLRICEKIRKQQHDVLTSRPRLNKGDLPLLFWRAWRWR